MARVLVVDDDPAITELVADMLRERGVEPVCAHSDREAYALIPTLPTFSALIVDINLGAGTTGFDVARFGRQVVPDLSVIYITGEATPEAFRAHGVPESSFLLKPFKAEDLFGKNGI